MHVLLCIKLKCTHTVLIWYTGHGKMINGDWIFEDGCVSFESLYQLYKTYLKGRHFYVISDCCYSGAWVVECARLLDADGIGCGHSAQREQVFIKVFASCLPNESSYDRCYTSSCKAVQLDCRGRTGRHSKTIQFAKHRKLCCGEFHQTTLGMDFTKSDMCVSDSTGACVTPNTWTWQVQSLIYEETSNEYCS